jgi:2-polyprenyl-3-methyl-5-hydroxy-6-metoxy-1,4-benzoquinol methylase
MARAKTYTLPVGTEDEQRLQALNRICNPYTLDFLNRCALDLNHKVVVDVGCGIGMMTMELAKRVGPRGKVIAVDISVEQLAIARHYADTQQLNNIEFICLDVHSLAQIDIAVDFIYSRFLLEHIKEPYHALREMNQLLKSGGHLFCENAISYEAMFCAPESTAYREWQEIILLQPKLHDTEFFIGKNLYAHYLTMGIQPKYHQLNQPFIKNREDRIQFHLITQSKVMQALLIEKGYYTEEKLLDITAKTIELMKEDVLVTFPQYIQIIGEKV